MNQIRNMIWDAWVKNLMTFDESIERNQPKEQQVREGLDELFN